MAALIVTISAQTCTFCQGGGHNAKQCSFKKNADKAFADAPAMRKIWGTLKSNYKRNGAQLAQKRKALVDILALETKADNMAGFQ